MSGCRTEPHGGVQEGVGVVGVWTEVTDPAELKVPRAPFGVGRLVQGRGGGGGADAHAEEEHRGEEGGLGGLGEHRCRACCCSLGSGLA